MFYSRLSLVLFAAMIFLSPLRLWANPAHHPMVTGKVDCSGVSPATLSYITGFFTDTEVECLGKGGWSMPPIALDAERKFLKQEGYASERGRAVLFLKENIAVIVILVQDTGTRQWTRRGILRATRAQIIDLSQEVQDP